MLTLLHYQNKHGQVAWEAMLSHAEIRPLSPKTISDYRTETSSSKNSGSKQDVGKIPALHSGAQKTSQCRRALFMEWRSSWCVGMAGRARRSNPLEESINSLSPCLHIYLPSSTLSTWLGRPPRPHPKPMFLPWRATVWQPDVCSLCQMVATIKLINTSPTSHNSCIFLYTRVWLRTFKMYFS